MSELSALERATGARGYRASPAEREDRASGMPAWEHSDLSSSETTRRG